MTIIPIHGVTKETMKKAAEKKLLKLKEFIKWKKSI